MSPTNNFVEIVVEFECSGIYVNGKVWLFYCFYLMNNSVMFVKINDVILEFIIIYLVAY